MFCVHLFGGDYLVDEYFQMGGKKNANKKVPFLMYHPKNPDTSKVTSF